MKIPTIATIMLAISTPAFGQASGPASADLDRAFNALDANKDGQVTRAEYGQVMQARHARQAEGMEAAFVVMDTNKDGKLSKPETAAVPVIASAFEALDADKNGSLSRAEMMSALAKSQAAQTAGE